MKRKISIVSVLHYIRLGYRSVLFFMLLFSYIRYRLYNGKTIAESMENAPAVLYVTWVVFIVEMVLRFFPSKY